MLAALMRERDLYPMTNLSPAETGLPFMVWLSPRYGNHSARIEVTLPPEGSHPEAAYQVQPFRFVDGQNWLTPTEERALGEWVRLNESVLIEFWDQHIYYHSDLVAKLIILRDGPVINPD